MAFKEVSVVQVREVLRRWLRGEGTRRAAFGAGVDRKTARGIIERAQARGVVREGGEAQLTDALLMSVEADGAPGNPGERGATWGQCEAHREFLAEKLSAGLTLTKTAELLARHTGEPMPYRTLHRFATQELGFSQQGPTVRVDDCAPGHEVQMDFGKLGMLTDSTDGSRRAVWALIFTAVFSRHMFVWLGHTLDLQAVIAGCEAAWQAFGGVFRVVVPDNLKPAVTTADRLNPRISDDFLAYAQSRGFETDPTRVRSPKDKPRVERSVRYTRDSFWAGETFGGLSEAQVAADAWCERVGHRVHGTTRRRPIEVFRAEELPALLPAPTAPYDIPERGHAKVGRDNHIVFVRAVYSVPNGYRGELVDVHADHALVRISHNGILLRTHPRQMPGGRSTHADDYPEGKKPYATRDVAGTIEEAAGAGPATGEYCRRLLAGTFSWGRLRRGRHLCGLVRRFNPDRVEAACARALALDAVDVMLIERMLLQATENEVPSPPPSSATAAAPRFARPVDYFAVRREAHHE
jgi:transposase